VLVEYLVCDPLLLVVVRCESGGGDGVEGKIGGGGTTEDGEAENGGGSYLDRLKQGIGGGLSRITTTTRVVPTAIPTPSNNGWPLPSPHTILQTSLYNYIRTTLRHAPMHPTTTGSSAFYEVMDLWLLWMEPWNVVHKTRCGGSSPPSSTSTKASKEFVHNVSEYIHSKSSPSSSNNRIQRQPSKASWKTAQHFNSAAQIHHPVGILRSGKSTVLHRNHSPSFREGCKNSISNIGSTRRSPTYSVFCGCTYSPQLVFRRWMHCCNGKQRVMMR